MRRRPVPAHSISSRSTSRVLIVRRALLAAEDVPEGWLRRADLPPPLLRGRREVVGWCCCCDWGLAVRGRRGPALALALALSLGFLPGLDAGGEVFESFF